MQTMAASPSTWQAEHKAGEHVDYVLKNDNVESKCEHAQFMGLTETKKGTRIAHFQRGTSKWVVPAKMIIAMTTSTAYVPQPKALSNEELSKKILELEARIEALHAAREASAAGRS